MFDPHLQTRIVQSWMDAMVGYSKATTNAYAMAFERSLDVWGDTMRQACGGEPARAAPAHPFSFNPFAPPQPSYAMGSPMGWGQPAIPDPLNLWSAWTSMTPTFNFWRTSTTVWPMVVMMMSNGVPQEVAVPTAEANAALMDATEAVQKSAETIFSSYRSEGGHASAQIIFLKNIAAMGLMVPGGAMAFSQWPFPAYPFQ